MPDQLFFDIVKMVVALACIVGLIFGVVMILKRFLPGASRPGDERCDLRVLGQLPMGARQRVCVIRVQDRTLVIGVTEGSISTLAELTTPRSAAEKEADDPQIFADLLTPRSSRPIRKDGGGPAKPEPAPAEGTVLRLRPLSDAPAKSDKPASNPDDLGDGPSLFAPGKGPAR